MLKIGIIGAGASGLCSLKHSLSLENVTCILWEHSKEIGGTWVYTESIGEDKYGYPIHSSMYKNLRTNLPKEIMAFPDFPFKQDDRSFLPHTDVLQYLNDYADNYNLLPFIKFSHHVEKVEPIDQEGGFRSLPKFRVSVKNLIDNSISQNEVDALFICNGHYSQPNLPRIKNLDSFEGKTFHSHSYRTPEPFRGSKIVVLGAGASGIDIALEISDLADTVYLSHNLPLPIPSDLPPNIQQVKGIKEATKTGFFTSDGVFIQADTLIYCTGYAYTFPFLSSSCGITVENNQVKPLYKHLVNCRYPSMGFIGIPYKICPFPFFDVQARYFVSFLTGSCNLPSESELEIELKRDGGDRHFHEQGHLGQRQWAYIEDLISCSSMKPLSKHYKAIWDIVAKRLVFSMTEFKRFSYSYYDKEGNSSLEVVEKLNGQIQRTKLDLLLLVSRQLLKLITFHFPKVAKFIITLGAQKVGQFLHCNLEK